LNRTVRLRFTGLAGKYLLRHHRVDEHHSNIAARFSRATPWPVEQQWAELQAGDELERIGLTSKWTTTWKWSSHCRCRRSR
jgi:xylan 1,4-beta-xylosidase